MHRYSPSLKLDGTEKIPAGRYQLAVDLATLTPDTPEPRWRDSVMRFSTLGVNVVAVQALQCGTCAGCLGAADESEDGRDCRAVRAGAQTVLGQPYCTNNQIFIPDTPEGWGEYLKAKLAGESR